MTRNIWIDLQIYYLPYMNTAEKLVEPPSPGSRPRGVLPFQTFIFGLLIIDLREETAWGGFMQTRLMATCGLLIGSLTAIPSVVIHIPLTFAQQAGKTPLGHKGARPWPARSTRAVLPIPARGPARRLRRQYPRDRALVQRLGADERGSPAGGSTRRP